MPGGVYSALSGMRLRLDDLDRIAADLANTETAGYKTERTSTETAPRAFQTALDAAIDATRGGYKVDFRPGTMNGTGRELDVAIDGRGFFEIETPAGLRYTRGGNFVRDTDGRLTTADGPALGRKVADWSSRALVDRAARGSGVQQSRTGPIAIRLTPGTRPPIARSDYRLTHRWGHLAANPRDAEYKAG